MKTYRVLTGLVLAMFLTVNAQASDDTLAEVQVQLEEASRSGVVLSAVASARISQALTKALASDHRGLKTSALRLVIAYGDVVELKRPAVIEMVRMYRDDTEIAVRQMAVVALGASGDEWATDFLKRSLDFEDSDRVLHTIKATLAS